MTSVMAKMERRKCALCPKEEDGDVIMYIAEEQKLAVHQNCLLYSSGFSESEELDLNARFDVAAVKKEIKRGKRLVCSYCHNNGATVGCEKKSCRRTYHYFCALSDGAERGDQQQGIYHVFCPKHKPGKKSSSNDEGSKNGMPLTLTKPFSTTSKMQNDETAGEENIQVLRRKDNPHKARIEFLKKCKEVGLLDDIFDDMLDTLHLAQEKLMDNNTSEAEYEEIVKSLLDYGLFENILTAAHSGKEKKIQELMNIQEKLDVQIELLKNFNEVVLPVSGDSASTSSSVSE